MNTYKCIDEQSNQRKRMMETATSMADELISEIKMINGEDHVNVTIPDVKTFTPPWSFINTKAFEQGIGALITINKSDKYITALVKLDAHTRCVLHNHANTIESFWILDNELSYEIYKNLDDEFPTRKNTLGFMEYVHIQPQEYHILFTTTNITHLLMKYVDDEKA